MYTVSIVRSLDGYDYFVTISMHEVRVHVELLNKEINDTHTVYVCVCVCVCGLNVKVQLRGCLDK